MSPSKSAPAGRGIQMPSHAFLIAAFLPAVAAMARLALHLEVGVWALLIWLLGLAPVFILTRYMGWRGALLGLAWTSAMVVMAELFASLMSGGSPDWSLVGTVVVVTASVALGAGLERQWWAADRAPAAAPPAQEMQDMDAGAVPQGEVLHYFLNKLFEAARRKPPLSIVLLEIDRFEEYMKMYGSAKVGEALDITIEALRSQTRASNMYGRLDGRRLVVFLNGETLTAAYGFSTRVLDRIAELEAPWSGRITISAGVAGFDPSMPNPDALLARARQALDTARRMGGERVVVADGSTGETLVTSGMTVVGLDGQVREIRETV